MSASQVVLGGFGALVVLQVSVGAVLVDPEAIPPVDLISVRYEPSQQGFAYHRIVRGEAVVAPYSSYVHEVDGGAEVEACRSFGVGSYDPNEPSVQMFAFDDFTAPGCFAELTRMQREDPTLYFEITSSVTPLGGAAGSAQSDSFRVVP